MKYFVKCVECGEVVPGKVNVHFVFHKALPYCWNCRNTLRDKWIEELVREHDDECGFGNGALT